MTLVDVIHHWAHRWRHLAAWRRKLPAVFEITPHKGQRILGRACGITGFVEIYTTGHLAEDLATVLHELAHVAAPLGSQHREAWSKLYVAGIAEACQCDADQFDTNVITTDLDIQCRNAVEGWLKRSGQFTVLRAIGVIST